MKTGKFLGIVGLTVGVFGLLLSCASSTPHIKTQLAIEIVTPPVPKTASVNQAITIKVTAQAPNGCYSRLGAILTAVDSRHLVMEGTALFETEGACAEVILKKDTTFTFKPTATGKYFFQTNKTPFIIYYDTMTVN
jgi:hypothetical protein